MFVIGQQNPDPKETRRLAACITGEPAPLQTWVKETGGILMADGTGIELEVSRFADPTLEMIRSQIADSSVIQAVGRCRPVNRTADTPVTVWVLSKIILPWPVNDLFRWEDVALDPVERMEARGVLTDSPSVAAALFPDLFPTPEATKKAIQRHRKRVQPKRASIQSRRVTRGQTPYKDTYKGNVPLSQLIVAWCSRHVATLSCIDSVLPGLEQRLTEALGPLEVFSVVEAPAPVARPVPAVELPRKRAPSVPLRRAELAWFAATSFCPGPQGWTLCQFGQRPFLRRVATWR